MKYKVPFVNYPLQYKNLKKEIDKAMSRVLKGGDLILRQDVDKFEKNLANFVGVKYAVSLNSGTDALFFSLLAAGIGKGDEVITVSHTFVAPISAIVQAGAKPVLVDVGEDYLMDMDKLEKAITKRTKAVIPVHLNGRMCDMNKLMEITQKHDLIVIEDAAQALGAGINSKLKTPQRKAFGFLRGRQNSKPQLKSPNFKILKAGAIGLTGCFSFYPAKLLGSFGDAGAVTTNDKRIADKIQLFRDHGQRTKTEIVCYGWNSRLDNLQAAVLNIKLKYLPKWIKRRREIAEIYNKELFSYQTSQIGQIGQIGDGPLSLPPAPKNCEDKHCEDNHCEDHCEDGPRNFDGPRYFDVFQNYVVRAKNRDKLYYYLKDNGVETLIKDPIPNHFQIGLRLSKFKLPFTEQLSKEVISLPIYPELTNRQVEYVISCIRDFYK